MIFLIGDVQGCDEALGKLLDEAGFSPSRDRLVLLGDLVNRGPQSLGVLQRLARLGDAAACLLGNHDLHLLATAHGVRKAHRTDTLQDILDHPQRDAWLDWLRHRPLALQVEGWLCVHAGVPPSWTAQQTLALAAEVSRELAGDGAQTLMQHLYGNEPSRWDDTLEGPARWRCIINALTRIRFCAPDGTMEFKAKASASQAPEGFMPWFEVPHRQTEDQPIAFGHWSTLGLINRDKLLALDSGCVWGGCLTAARVDGGRREIVQVRCDAQLTPG
jgi:bis(5'-nucleosyl)-tetraphosphatase (symmetrical)